MPLVTSTEMFKKAYDGGYAIGAFNVNNMEIVQGITEAAKDLNAPLILQVSKLSPWSRWSTMGRPVSMTAASTSLMR